MNLNMKYFAKTVGLLLLSLFLLSCNAQQGGVKGTTKASQKLSTQTTSSVPDVLKVLLQYVERPYASSEWMQGFSPDGNWFLKNTRTGSLHRTFEGFFLQNPQLGFNSLPDASNSVFLVVPRDGWAADSSAFIAEGADEGRAGCPFSHIVIYHVDPNSYRTQNFTFTPDTGGTCVNAIWSPDSNRLAVVVPTEPDTIYLINKQGELEKKISLSWPDLQPNAIILQQWIESGLVYGAVYPTPSDTNPIEQLYELRLLDPQEVDQQYVMASGSHSMKVDGIDFSTPRILFSEIGLPDHTTRLTIYNLTTHEIEKTISMPWSHSASLQRLSPYIAFQVRNEVIDKHGEMWIFDWQTLEFKSYGQIGDLITWLPNEDGFLVVQGDEETGYWFEIVQP